MRACVFVLCVSEGSLRLLWSDCVHCLWAYWESHLPTPPLTSSCLPGHCSSNEGELGRRESLRSLLSVCPLPPGCSANSLEARLLPVFHPSGLQMTSCP